MKIIAGACHPVDFKPGAEAIMWWEETPVSHCYIVFEIFDKRVVFQAVGAGTQFLSYVTFVTHNVPMYEKEIEVSEYLYKKIVLKAIERLGTKYSRLHLLGLFYKRAIQYLFKKVVACPFKDKGLTAVCVEVLCFIVDMTEIKRKAEDPEDMGMFEALKMLQYIEGKVLINEILHLGGNPV